MAKSDRDHAEGSVGEGNGGGQLQEALRAYEVGLEGRTERIAAPGDAGNGEAGFAEQGIVDGDGQGRVWGQFGEDGAADDGEQVLGGEAVLTEDPVGGGPVLKLAPGGGQQSGEGMAAEAEQRA